ncbi:unnamed protein product [Alopecurus aequalis]
MNVFPLNPVASISSCFQAVPFLQLQLSPMQEYHWFYDEEWDDYLQNILFHEEPHYLVDSSFENQLAGAPFYDTRHLCTSITQNFLQVSLCVDELDAPSHGDVLIPWPALEQGAHNKGDEELRQALGGDAAELGRNAAGKKRKYPKEKPLLTFELVSQYFCMPMKQAGEELNVGVTHLKRKCRELGIPRWPHRKVKSLETLIKNAQELGKPNIEVEKVQRKKLLIEERPGHVELDQEMKLLRQACFKEKFKRRRLVAIQG